MSGLLLIPCCTFGRVFDTTPLNEVLTLPELTAALRRFELKPQTMANIEREIARIKQAHTALARGEAPRGKFMGKLAKAADAARREGRDPLEAIATLAASMEDEARRSAKRDLRLWSPALYRPGADKRGSENVTHVSCLVLDYDDGTSVQDASVTWSSWFHIVYTTWSHTPERPKFRLLMPLAFPVRNEDWAKVWSWAEEHSRFEIDPSMKSPAATYALPAVPHRGWPREAFSRPGAILDPVDEGILERRTVLDLAPKRPPEGTPSVIRGEDPEHEYLDHEDPEGVYFVDEEWDEGAEWDAPTHEASPSREAGGARGGEAEAQAETPPAPTPLPPPAPREEERLERAIERLEALGDGARIVDALERLVALHREGWLSAEELAEAKRRVIAEPIAPPGDVRRIGPGRHRRTLSIDFDGVIHSYASGWQGPTEIPDPPVEGAIAWLAEAAERFDVAICSVRCAQPGAIDAMRAWLRKHGLPEHVLARIRFPHGKPPAELYIDDRAYRFDGVFPSFDAIADLEPWTKKRTR